MNHLIKLAGIHFLIMLVYIVVVGLISTDMLMATMFLLPIHVISLLIASIRNFIEYARDKTNNRESLVRANVYLLTTFTIAIIGFSSCSHMFINKI